MQRSSLCLPQPGEPVYLPKMTVGFPTILQALRLKLGNAATSKKQKHVVPQQGLRNESVSEKGSNAAVVTMVWDSLGA